VKGPGVSLCIGVVVLDGGECLKCSGCVEVSYHFGRLERLVWGEFCDILAMGLRSAQIDALWLVLFCGWGV